MTASAVICWESLATCSSAFLRRSGRITLSNISDRKSIFAVAALSVLAAKFIHLKAHFGAITATEVVLWGPSFFFQDVLVLAAQFSLVERTTTRRPAERCIAATAFSSILATLLLILAAMSLSFFAVSGTELQWHNVAVALDPAWWTMLPIALLSFAAMLIALLCAALSFRQPLYGIAKMTSAQLYLLAGCLLPKLPIEATYADSVATQENLVGLSTGDAREPGHDSNTAQDIDEHGAPVARYLASCQRPRASIRSIMTTSVLVWIPLSTVLRPSGLLFRTMSWTILMLPIVDMTRSSGSVAVAAVSQHEISRLLTNRTSLAQPRALPWLPIDTKLAGFEDWYGSGSAHYDATSDPLHLSNLDDDPIEALRPSLSDLEIRHILLVFVESQRKDAFPLKRDGFIWNQLADSFQGSQLPADAQQKLASLTPNANAITGDYDDGFAHQKKRGRGGINANNAHTTSTYTLKSLTGTLCGITPVAADFNVEVESHIYQPCLPHVFEWLNRANGCIGGAAKAGNESKTAYNTDDFRTFPWKSVHMQSATTGFDKQDTLLLRLGFDHENIINREYLERDTAKFGKVTVPEVNYFSLPEDTLEPYIQDAIASATNNDERLFLSHLTSTTHHDFGLPAGETRIPLAGNSQHEQLSRYMNTVAYSDRWLGKILQILDSNGIANQTLTVFVGDHGLPLAEGTISTYGDAHSASSRVPLVLSHPQLPPVAIDEIVSTRQIVPSILDLLVETNSLSAQVRAAMTDLRNNYEGQSLLRPIRRRADEASQGNWQFTIVNPGGSMLSVRDAQWPEWHLVVPLSDAFEWRFGDLLADPQEMEQIVAFDLEALIERVRQQYGPNASTWVANATAVSAWWAQENHKLWRYAAFSG